MLHIAVLLLAWMVTVPVTVAAQNSAGTTEAVLTPGDSLRITVWLRPEYSGAFAVRHNGTIADPYYSEVQVAWLPLSTIEQRVRDYIAITDAAPRVIVEPLFRVSVAGEVRQPGVYGFPLGSTMSEAVLRAGGANERGRISRVELHRDGRRYVLDLTRADVNAGGMEVRSGDQVVVTQRREIFRDFIVPAATIAGAAAAIVNVMESR